MFTEEPQHFIPCRIVISALCALRNSVVAGTMDGKVHLYSLSSKSFDPLAVILDFPNTLPALIEGQAVLTIIVLEDKYSTLCIGWASGLIALIVHCSSCMADTLLMTYGSLPIALPHDTHGRPHMTQRVMSYCPKGLSFQHTTLTSKHGMSLVLDRA